MADEQDSEIVESTDDAGTRDGGGSVPVLIHPLLRANRSYTGRIESVPSVPLRGEVAFTFVRRTMSNNLFKLGGHHGRR